jgi:hypothetical protein
LPVSGVNFALFGEFLESSIAVATEQVYCFWSSQFGRTAERVVL